MAIRFDSLGIVLNHIPRSVSILGFEITILGILLAVSMMLGVIWVVLEAKRKNQNQDFYLGAICMAVLGAILGGRAFYAAFSWNLFQSDPWELIQLRNGGMAYYGALIGGWLLVALFCKVRSVSFGETADTLTFAVLLVQIATRLGDFFNRESFGQYTEWPVAMQLPLTSVRSSEVTSLMRENLLTIDGTSWIQVHPAFLYECVWCLLIFLFLLIVRRKKVFAGEIFYRYLALYGLGRFFIEYLRTDQLWIPETTYPISMILAAVFFVLFTMVGSVRRSMEKKRAELKKRRQMEYDSKPEVEEDDQPVDIDELLREEEEYRRSLERAKEESKEEAEAAAEPEKPVEDAKPAERQDELAVTEPEEAEAGQTETEEAEETEPEEAEAAEGETEPEEAEAAEGETEPEEAEAAEGETEPEEAEAAEEETEPEEAEAAEGKTEPEEIEATEEEPEQEEKSVGPEEAESSAYVEKKAVKKKKTKKKFRMPIFRKKEEAEEAEKKEETVAEENPQSRFIIPVPPIKMEFESEKDKILDPDLEMEEDQNNLSYEEFLIEPEPEPELITDEDIENLILEIADNEEEEDDAIFSLDEFEMEKPVE